MSREQEAGELYSQARGAVMEGGVRISMIVNHIITMIRGWEKYPEGHLWRDREVPPEGKAVHLDRFEDYLLKPAREGLGFSSLLEVHKIIEAHNRKAAADTALALLRQEIPDYDAKVNAAKVERVEPAKLHGGERQGSGRKAEQDNQVDNINLIDSKTKGGTSADYLAARIKRDHPQIAAGIAAGEYPSIRAAAIAAGIVKVPSALEAAKRAALRLTDADRTELLTWLAASSEARS